MILPQNYKYTAADFERYHSGQMNESEMHALEKAALQDPFLAEALEGYSYTDTPGKDISELKEKLSAKKKKRNIFFVKQKDNIWLRIAALFILITGIGYLAYQLNVNKENNALAKNEKGYEAKSATEQTPTPGMDSIANSEKQNIVSSPPAEKSKEFLLNKKIYETPKPDLKSSNDNTIEKPAENPAQESMQKTIFSKDKDYAATNDVKSFLKGKIVDSTGNAVRFATIKDKNRNIVTSSDSVGRFKLMLNDTSLTATISAIGYKTKETRLRDNGEQIVVIEHDNQNLSEVVVTAMGKQRQKREINSAPVLKSKVPGVSVINSVSEPVNGWQEFEEYIQANMKIPRNEEGKSYKGQVVLSFEINKNGNLKKIKVDQSLCALCDEEAIRLLVQGPKWKYINDKKSVVTIQF